MVVECLLVGVYGVELGPRFESRRLVIKLEHKCNQDLREKRSKNFSKNGSACYLDATCVFLVKSIRKTVCFYYSYYFYSTVKFSAVYRYKFKRGALSLENLKEGRGT